MNFVVMWMLQRVKYHRAQTLDYRNGYALKTAPSYGIGGDPINYNQLSEKELDELAAYNPTLTYGQAKAAAPPPFVPSYVSLDKKVRDQYHKVVVALGF